MNRKVLAAAAMLTVAGGAAQAQQMVFTSWGGTTQDAQTEFWAAPFSEKTGTAVVQDGPTDYGKIKAMVEADATNWDVVDVEFDWALQAGQKGLLEPLDFTVIDKAALDPRFVSDYAVGSFYYSFVMGWNEANFPGDKPATLADLRRDMSVPALLSGVVAVVVSVASMPTRIEARAPWIVRA